MKKAFVKTENYARFAAGVKAVEQRGAAEAGMMLVHGQPGYGKSHIVERCLRVLVERQCPIIIDEAEFTLSSNAAVLEKVRDFSDRAEVTVILIGMEQIQRSIARHKQISSRIAQVVEFGPCTGSDVALACTQLCDYQLSPGMTAASPVRRTHARSAEHPGQYRAHRRHQRPFRPAGRAAVRGRGADP